MWIEWIGQSSMDARTEQSYQRRIAELTHQLAEHKEQFAQRDAAILELRVQLTQRDAAILELRVQLTQRDATIAALQQQIAALSKQVAELLAQVARLSKNSSNSFKPPSSDIVKPPPPVPPGEKRSIGGQKGHVRHEREPFTPAQVKRVVDYRLYHGPTGGGPVYPLEREPRKLQQVEIPALPVEVTEYRRHGYFCPHGQKVHKVHYAPLPPEIQAGGLVGQRPDGVDCVSQGGLSLFLFHNPQVLPGCITSADFPGSTGQGAPESQCGPGSIPPDVAEHAAAAGYFERG